MHWIFVYISVVIQTGLSLQYQHPCTFSPEIIDCSGQQLNTLPIPESWNKTNIKSLLLDNNHLSTIPDLSGFENLLNLDLSGNRLAEIPAHTFDGLHALQSLDLSSNDGLILSNLTLHVDSFYGLESLVVLRLKQARRPSDGFDYSQLALLNRTLEELYMSGTPAISGVFEHFSQLHTLSLGGAGCYIPTLDRVRFRSLLRAPLKRISARNCGISRVEVEFLNSYTQTLLKLDLSCNPLRQSFRNIVEGVQGSNLSTLLLDNINRVQVDSQHTCAWNNITDDDISPLKDVPLRIASFQGNQVGLYKDINIRLFCSGLTYLDVSHNNFSSTAFYISSSGESLPAGESGQASVNSIKSQLPAVRYLGHRGSTSAESCDGGDTEKYNCNEDNYLFLEDDFYWDFNHNPDIVDFMFLRQTYQEFTTFLRQNQSYSCRQNIELCATNYLMEKSHAVRLDGEYAPTDRAIIATVRNIMNAVNQDPAKVDQYFKTKVRYLQVNLTTLSLGDNKWFNSTEEKVSNLCSNFVMFPNNAATLDFSGSEFGFLPCRNISGFIYLTNLTCNRCFITGWHSDLFSKMPLKYLHLSQARGLAKALQQDKAGSLLVGMPGLEVMDISGIEINYFTDSSLFTHTSNLTHVYTQNNNLTSWNITIRLNTRLQMLDLRNNAISYINKTFRDEISKQFQRTGMQVHLAGNSVDCGDNCTANDYVKWLMISPAVADANAILCAGTSQPVGHYFISKDLISDTCSGTRRFSSIVLVSLFIGLSSILFW